MLKIEIVIRKKIVKESINEFSDVILKFKTFESDERCVLDIDPEWEGFKDGTMFSMMKEFNEGVYIALAYYTSSDHEIVVDIDGEDIDRYSVVVDGLVMNKYVKKKLMIVRILDKENEKFEIKAYMINVEFMNPIVKILDIYSFGKESGITLSKLVKKNL